MKVPMCRYPLNDILQEWMTESGVRKPVQFSYAKGELFIYTSYPGYLIGKRGVLYDKYKSKLMDKFSDLSSIHLVEVHNVEVIKFKEEDYNFD